MNPGYKIEVLKVGPLETNCYIVSGAVSGTAVIIDPGAEAERIIAVLNGLKARPEAVINTHGHADHIAANDALKNKFGLRIYIHRADAAFLKDPLLNGSCLLPGTASPELPADELLEDGSAIRAGGLVFKVVHTPGHTPGGVCLCLPGALFTGDTLFRGDIGRSDLAGGSEEELMRSLKVFRKYPAGTAVYPGHGPSSTIGRELSENPYL